MIGASKKSSLDLDDREDDPMTLKFKLTKKPVNTQFGPVAALLAYYEQQQVLEPFRKVVPAVKKSDFSLASQLTQVLLSILTGCEYLSQVNTRLRPERKFAQVYRIDQFAHSSTLSRSLSRADRCKKRKERIRTKTKEVTR